MDMFFIIVVLILLALLGIVFYWSKRLEAQVAVSEKRINALMVEKSHIYTECQAELANAQKLVDQQIETLKGETERIHRHFETEARHIRDEADALQARTRGELESLRKYETMRSTETEAHQLIRDALNEANSLRAEARSLLELARVSASEDKASASSKVQEIYDQADARLNQATRDAGRIIAEASKRAEQIGGHAYVALRDKQTLEQAVEAMRNLIEGYGNRYLISTRSLIDDLAIEFGYTSAGEALKSAREQSRRMIEQGEAADCEYTDGARRETAIRFVIDAFNGRVDAILSRTKSDNYGTLEQEIRDACSLVNLNGKAFRDAHILPLYLDARLAELRWAVVVQELALKQREEQRYLREKMRDEQRAFEEQQKQMRETEHEEELKNAALAEAELKVATAHAGQKAQLEAEAERLRLEIEELKKKKLTIAQKTRVGNVYVISNIGSFGEGVYKIGLTRRDTEERVYELSGASVPFEFDIDAEIKTEDAPGLEYKLHNIFLPAKINKMNPRKEFFRVSLNEIKQEIDKMLTEGEKLISSVRWTEKAKAIQYYESHKIEQDPEEKERWIQRERASVEYRRKKYSVRALPLDGFSSFGTTDNSTTASIPEE